MVLKFPLKHSDCVMLFGDVDVIEKDTEILSIHQSVVQHNTIVPVREDTINYNNIENINKIILQRYKGKRKIQHGYYSGL